MLSSLRINSQEIFQQSVIELKEALDGKQTYLYRATSSIEMMPGFSYVPTSDNNMSLDIDRYSVFPPLDDKYGGYSADNNCVVGSIPATINVSSTGAAYYSVDIQLPMALGGMTPNLSLAYNNQSSDGLLGWSLMYSYRYDYLYFLLHEQYSVLQNLVQTKEENQQQITIKNLDIFSTYFTHK